MPAASAARLTLNGSWTLLQVPHEVGVGEQVAEAQPGEPEDLRERAQDHDAAAVGDVLLAAHALERGDVVHVRLVGDHDAVGADRVEERAPLRRLEAQAGRVVRVADPDELRVGRADRGGDRLEVEAQLGRVHALDARARDAARLRVQAVGRRGHDDRVAGVHERVRRGSGSAPGSRARGGPARAARRSRRRSPRAACCTRARDTPRTGRARRRRRRGRPAAGPTGPRSS